MNETQFLHKLEAALHKLPDKERGDILQDFKEHFSIGREEGKTEEAIASSLGSPQQIAKELLATHYLDQVDHSSSMENIFRAVWAIIGLSFFNLVIVLGPFIALVSIIFAGWVVAGGFVLSLPLIIIQTLIYPEMFLWFDVFISIGLLGAGILLAIGMLYTTRVVSKGFIRYLHYNAKLVKGGMKHA